MSDLFRLLPDHVRNADDGTLAAFLSGVQAALSPVTNFVNAADPDIAPGVEPVSPDYTPASWLPWLARLLGADISGLRELDARWFLSQLGKTETGSLRGMRTAVGATLTGTRSVAVTRQSLWEMTVTVDDAEVVDIALTQAVAQRTKPAGVNLSVVTDSLATIDSLATSYTTVAGIAATGKNLDLLRFG